MQNSHDESYLNSRTNIRPRLVWDIGSTLHKGFVEKSPVIGRYVGQCGKCPIFQVGQINVDTKGELPGMQVFGRALNLPWMKGQGQVHIEIRLSQNTPIFSRHIRFWCKPVLALRNPFSFPERAANYWTLSLANFNFWPTVWWYQGFWNWCRILVKFSPGNIQSVIPVFFFFSILTNREITFWLILPDFQHCMDHRRNYG